MSKSIRFGIITDTHVRAPRGDQSSPFPVNDLANDRARVACQLLAAQEPEFTIHLGDMVHPLPHMSAYADACTEALEIFAPLPDVHFVPGNHDIGDKPMPASPAVPATDDSVAIYADYFKDSYHAFQKGDCLIVVINSSILNTGTQTEHEQRAWLEATLSQSDAPRTILFSHYPPFIHSPDEAEHYDNIAEPARSWLLDLLQQYKIDCVFSGHVHHYFYNRYHDTQLYVLPPTSFTRQDYAELYRIDPCAEYGRNDTGKFCVTMVEVTEDAIEPTLIPTDGAQHSDAPAARIVPASIKPFSVHLRHAWHESIDLPYNGPMEEFSRKRAHNDYTLMRLKQLGIQQVRVPLQDIADPVIAARVRDYRNAGIQFHAFCLADTLPQIKDSINTCTALIESLEIVVKPEQLQAGQPDAMASLPQDLKLHLSKVHSSSHTDTGDKPFAHSVSSGFLWSEVEAVFNAIEQWPNASAIKGIVFQIPLETDPVPVLSQMQQRFASTSMNCIANVRLAHSNPAVGNFDDDAITTRVVSAMEACATLPALQIQFDTFADIDRGYGPRHGFIDRHMNLRPVGRAMLHR